VFGNESTRKIKMQRIETMLCGRLIGIDKLGHGCEMLEKL